MVIKYKKVQMTEEDLVDAKLQLAHCKLQKDETDLNLEEMEKQLEAKIPIRLIEEDIDRLKKDIKEKKVYDSFGKNVDATDTDIDRMIISLDKLKKIKKLDIPGRKLRQGINQLRDAKIRPDAPELQIKKLEKQIREKAYEKVDNSTESTMHN